VCCVADQVLVVVIFRQRQRMISSEEILVFSGNNLTEKLAWMMIGYSKWKLTSSGRR